MLSCDIPQDSASHTCSNKYPKHFDLTNSVTAMASAQEMCAILEAYWQLSAKRLTDNMCMLVDREILGECALDTIPCYEELKHHL